MSRYLFNEGSFDSLDVGIVDSTVHVLELEPDGRLFVDRRPLRAGATARLLAESRTGHATRGLPRYTVMGERELSGPPAFEVAAHFRNGIEIVYERRTHLVVDGGAFAFTMRGAMEKRADIDGCMDAVLATLRFRDDAWDGVERYPGLYVTNDLAFEIAEQSFTDRTIHELDAALPGEEALGVLIERAAMPHGATLGDAARAHVQADGRRLPLHKVLALGELAAFGAPAVEVVSEWTYRGVARHCRQLHVAAARAAHLIVSTTAPALQADVCDRYFDEIVSTLALHG